MNLRSFRFPVLLASVMAGTLGQAPAVPAIGDAVPELTAYDADGKAFNLAQRLKGHYSVVVFGCLT